MNELERNRADSTPLIPRPANDSFARTALSRSCGWRHSGRSMLRPYEEIGRRRFRSTQCGRCRRCPANSRSLVGQETASLAMTTKVQKRKPKPQSQKNWRSMLRSYGTSLPQDASGRRAREQAPALH